MADPTTVNIGLAVPTRGSDPGTWDVPMNSNSAALDGYTGGVATISISGTNIVLTTPAGVTVTPGAGPSQVQNKVLIFTGALSANVTVTLPFPSEYTIQNLTTGNFIVIFAAAGAGNVVSTPQGSIKHVWNDGTNVWLVKSREPGELMFYGGLIAVPAWITACTIPPYLLCDGSIYNFTAFPALANLYKGNFGGNGTTTFGVEDLQGRVPLAYDGTGTRITTAGSNINGQTLGASGGGQNETLITANLPPYTPHGSVASTPSLSVLGTYTGQFQSGSNVTGLNNEGSLPVNGSISSVFTGSAQGGTSRPVITVPPAQVAGIWLVST